MIVHIRPSFVPLGALLLAAGIAVMGCGGSKGHSRSGGGGAAPTQSSGIPALTYLSVAVTGSASLLGANIPVHVFRLTNPSFATVTLTSLTVQASGTVNEVAFIQSAALIVDTNANGTIDAGETTAAQIGSAWTTNDGAVTFGTITGATIAASSNRQFIVAAQLVPITGTAAQAAVVGSTVIVGIQAASSIAATSSQGTHTTTGTFPSNNTPIVLGVHPHLLITEVVTGPGNAMGVTAEYIEIFNPTPSTVSLANTYLTDFTIQPTTNPPTQAYYRLPQGNNFGPAASLAGANTDFVVRFPATATIAPGAIIIIAIDGVGYRAARPAPAPAPNFCLKNAGTSGAVQMLTWDGNATTTTPPNFTAVQLAQPLAQLTNAGEQLWLYTWNQSADIIVDVDMVLWGVASAENTSIAKSGLAIDGIDAGTTTSTYLADTAENLQENVRAQASGDASIQRVDFNESTETKTGGNGQGGHNETSENWRTAFTSGTSTTATPGALQ